MNHLKITVLLAGLLSMALAQAHSGDYYNHFGHYRDGYPGHGVNQRQRNQHWRIEEGIESGRLTPWEARNLSRQQHQIARLEHRFKRDGWLSGKEKRILRNRLDQASQTIYDLKHNDHDRPYGYEDVYYR